MNQSARILLVEDDPSFRALIAAILEDEGYQLTEKDDGKAALMMLQRQQFDLVLTDLRLPGLNGLELFRAARHHQISTPFVLLTAFGTVEEAVAAMKEGVSDFLTKPLKDPESLRSLVRKILSGSSVQPARIPSTRSKTANLPPDEVLFAGNAMQAVKKLISDVAPTPATVLITGESGTGKELAARAIHAGSPRKTGPFIAINCAAIPENLLESELFGHEKGAFTGATQTRQGKFELACGGTLFLDEIGEMPLLLQTKLLRVLQERVFERVGGSSLIKADLRIITATNRDLLQEVQERRFREDLYYRLHVFPIALPPLRLRLDGLPDLIEYLISQISEQISQPGLTVAPDALQALCQYTWPGNIRELQNILERAAILSKGQITRTELPDIITSQARASAVDSGSDTNLKGLERAAILETLAACGNNRRLAAEQLGISKRTLQYRLKEYGLTEVQ